MILKPSAGFQVQSFGGASLRNSQCHEPSFGKTNMKIIGKRGIIFKRLGLLRAPTFGILLWKIEALSNNIAS